MCLIVVADGSRKGSLHQTMRSFSIRIIESWSTLKTNNKHTQRSVNRNQFDILKFIKLLNNLIWRKHDPARVTIISVWSRLFKSFNQCQSPDVNSIFNWMKLNQRAYPHLNLLFVKFSIIWEVLVRGVYAFCGEDDSMLCYYCS